MGMSQQLALILDPPPISCDSLSGEDWTQLLLHIRDQVMEYIKYFKGFAPISSLKDGSIPSKFEDDLTPDTLAVVVATRSYGESMRKILLTRDGLYLSWLEVWHTQEHSIVVRQLKDVSWDMHDLLRKEPLLGIEALRRISVYLEEARRQRRRIIAAMDDTQNYVDAIRARIILPA